jgi:hypothetical protein
MSQKATPAIWLCAKVVALRPADRRMIDSQSESGMSLSPTLNPVRCSGRQATEIISVDGQGSQHLAGGRRPEMRRYFRFEAADLVTTAGLGRDVTARPMR